MPEQIPFNFERETQLTPDLFVAIYQSGSRPLRILRRAAVALVGLVLLLWSYTLLLGVAVLCLVLMATFMPALLRRVFPSGMRTNFELSPHLHSPVTFGVSNEKIWARGIEFEQSSSWNNLATWKENAGWLRLVPNGQSHVYFRVSELKEAGLYGSVLEKAESSAPEFDGASRRAA